MSKWCSLLHIFRAYLLQIWSKRIPTLVDSFRCNVTIAQDVGRLYRYVNIMMILRFYNKYKIISNVTCEQSKISTYLYWFQSFVFECDNLLKNRTDQCTDRCKNTLIGLTSTVEGRKLMNVSLLYSNLEICHTVHSLKFYTWTLFQIYVLNFQCNCNGDFECLNARKRIEACRNDVIYANRLDTVVSCTEAQWICTADAECSKALEYYNLLCKGMFKGKRCNQRCKNSIQILTRQTKAIKLGRLLT